MRPDEKKHYYELAGRLISEQNFGVAVFAGIIAMILSAGVYAVLTVAVGTAYGFMAVGIGVAVGWVIQFLGRGVTVKFSVVAAVLALAGCFLGSSLSVTLAAARETGVTAVDIYADMDFIEMIGQLVSEARFVDWLFWTAAIGSAWYFARRPLTREEFSAIRLYETRVEDGVARGS